MPDLELSLLNSLKVLFSGLGAKNSDNNYAVPLFSKSDATPVGFMNLSDLASVLGAFGYAISIPSNSDLDDYMTVGRYTATSRSIAQTIANIPESDKAFVVEIISLNGSENNPVATSRRILQEFIPNETGAAIEYKRLWNGNSWSSWYKYEGVAVP